MVISSKTRILLFIIINIMLLILLYSIPLNTENQNTICIFKNMTGKDCWNCGMTRAFLCLIHLDFYNAYKFNSKVIIVFPLTVGIYLYSWYKYIFTKEYITNIENERRCKR